jgi:hypothetical protein
MGKAFDRRLRRRIPVALLALAVAFLPSCQKRRPVSPELQRFVDGYVAVENGMTEEQTDSLLAGFRSSAGLESTDVTNLGQPLTRPSARVKCYLSRPDANEGDYYINVYFDESGRVVGKSGGELCS